MSWTKCWCVWTNEWEPLNNSLKKGSLRKSNNCTIALLNFLVISSQPVVTELSKTSMSYHRKLFVLIRVTWSFFFLPVEWLSLSPHEPIYETLQLLNCRLPFVALNKVLFAASLIIIPIGTDIYCIYLCLYITAETFFVCSCWIYKSMLSMDKSPNKRTSANICLCSLQFSLEKLLLWNHWQFFRTAHRLFSLSVIQVY